MAAPRPSYYCASVARMIDLHCHMLPGIDDGPTELADALAMARMAAEDGIVVTACTPHIYPGLYENDAGGIGAAIERFRRVLEREQIALRLVEGADVHMTPDLVAGLRSGRIPTLAGSRYFLFEPPHHIAPPRLDQIVFDTLAAGYVPIITHPERLSWVESHYRTFIDLVHRGAWLQLTAGALTGGYGRRPRYWAERFLDEGAVHILASDAHHPRRRPPLMAEARAAAARRLGAAEADNLVQTRPRGILDNLSPTAQPPIPAAAAGAERGGKGVPRLLRKWFGIG